ncbi:PPOX class F420-dependent oxidoreductase [Actinomadura rayongensis]|uniref:TIGR03618 family F420-dependent PPOX class oxidoreductase n=1 Tax=Actinomadura rayongensis TaxID=1429076 RepID=A0A6I4WH37_9ACTN|nr:PPOX class F420-dependent oxidoreductase [Actinomadura rayongensis]MXQ67146.1 TIGR03618 family F420-dependent PPOX class oxidoreductase [Actinomadura rayongensis]
MENMSEPEWRAFVSEGTRTAKVAVTRKDGAPHVTPVWFVLDGDDLVFNTGAETVKGRALARDPRVALCVEDDTPPYSFVTIHGEAELSDDVDAMLPLSIRIGARYMGEERGEQFGRRNAVPGELLVRVRVRDVVAQRDLAD